MMRLSVFHSRYGAAALAAALNYSWGGAGRTELVPGLRRLSNAWQEPRSFVSSDETLLVVGDRLRPAVIERAITSLVGTLRPDVELVFYGVQEIDYPFMGIVLWLLAKGFLPNSLAEKLATQIWCGVRRWGVSA